MTSELVRARLNLTLWKLQASTSLCLEEVDCPQTRNGKYHNSLRYCIRQIETLLESVDEYDSATTID